MTGIAASHRRKPVGDIYDGPPPEPWLDAALEAARLAPSAVNRQSWRFTWSDGGLTVEVDSPRDSYSISRGWTAA